MAPVSAPLLIAIDGPAAAGKGTLARRLAAHFGLPYLDTGLLYRAVARRVIDSGQSPADATAAAEAARVLVPEDTRRGDLRGPPVDEAASLVASVPAVRAARKSGKNTMRRAVPATTAEMLRERIMTRLKTKIKRFEHMYLYTVLVPTLTEAIS